MNLTDKHIVFGCGFAVGKEEATHIADPEGLIQRRKTDAMVDLGQKLLADKPDIWEERESDDASATEYTARVYVLTPAELKQWQQNIVAKVKSGEIK